MNQLAISIILIFLLSCQSQKEKREQNVADFKITGIAVETTNEGGKSIEDMGKLWGQFYQESISDKIPNKVSEDVYSLYTTYESDYKGSYIAIIGHQVNSLEAIPEGLVGYQFEGGKYIKRIAKGKMPEAVVDTWKKIWEEDQHLNRSYRVDFEVYGKKSQSGSDSEVEVFIAVE